MNQNTFTQVLCTLPLALIVACGGGGGTSAPTGGTSTTDFSLRGITSTSIELPEALNALVEHGNEQGETLDSDSSNIAAQTLQPRAFFGVDDQNNAQNVDTALRAGRSEFERLEYRVAYGIEDMEYIDQNRQFMLAYLELMLIEGCGSADIKDVEACSPKGTIVLANDADFLEEVRKKIHAIEPNICSTLANCGDSELNLAQLLNQPETVAFEKLTPQDGYQFGFKVGFVQFLTDQSGVDNSCEDDFATMHWTPAQSDNPDAKILYLREYHDGEGGCVDSVTSYALSGSTHTYWDKTQVTTGTESVYAEDFTGDSPVPTDIELYQRTTTLEYEFAITIEDKDGSNPHTDIQLTETTIERFEDQISALDAQTALGEQELCGKETSLWTCEKYYDLFLDYRSDFEYQQRVLNISGNEELASVEAWTRTQYPEDSDYIGSWEWKTVDNETIAGGAIWETEIYARAKYGKSSSDDSLLFDYSYCFAKIVSNNDDAGDDETYERTTQNADCTDDDEWHSYSVDTDKQLGTEALNTFDVNLETVEVHFMAVGISGTGIPSDNPEYKTYHAFYKPDGVKSIYVCTVEHLSVLSEALLLCPTTQANFDEIKADPSVLELYENTQSTVGIVSPSGAPLSYTLSSQ